MIVFNVTLTLIYFQMLPNLFFFFLKDLRIQDKREERNFYCLINLNFKCTKKKK